MKFYKYIYKFGFVTTNIARILHYDVERELISMYGGIISTNLDSSSLADSMRDWNSEYVDFAGVLVPLRKDMKDFPDVTQSHYALNDFISQLVVPKRISKDFPGVTSLHKGLSNVLSHSNRKFGEPVVDIGCGLGALGVSLASKFRLHKLIMSDLSPAAIEHSKRTFTMNASKLKTDKRNIEFKLGNAVETLSNLDGGVGFAAPYLIPEVCVMFGGIYDILGQIVQNQDMDIYVSHSNLSQALVDKAVDQNNLTRESNVHFVGQPLHPEYANSDIPKQLAQKRARMLFPDTIAELKKLGLVEFNGVYLHDIVVSKLSRK